jgi:hypothetical protein
MQRSYDMNKFKAQSFRKDVQELLDVLGQKYEMRIDLGGITYTNNSIKSSIKGRYTDALTETQEEYDNVAFRYGLPPRGSVIKTKSGEIYQMFGYKRRAPKRPIIMKDMSDQQWVVSRSYVADCVIIQVGDE